MTPTPELKRCPFCGGEARHSFQSGDERVGYVIEGKASCSKCTASVVLFSRCSASGWNEETWDQLRPRITALWNRRQPAQPAVAGEVQPDGYLYAYDGYLGRHWQLDSSPYNGRREPDEVKPYWFAPPAAAFDPGLWQVVPKVATKEMLNAMEHGGLNQSKYLKALAAAPALLAEPLDEGREREAAIASAEELPPSKTFSSHLYAYVAGWLARARAGRDS